jgi:hypothetical protein
VGGFNTRIAFAAGLAVASLALPVRADATTVRQIITTGAGFRGQSSSLTLRGSHGYRIKVEGSGRVVELSASRSLTGATYSTRGRVTSEGITARFGNLGRIAVGFVPSGPLRVRKPPPFCEGQPRTMQSGVFTGKIRFSGEEQFTQVEARRAKGLVSNRPRWKCDNPANHAHPHGNPSPPSAILSVSQPNGSIEFSAEAPRRGSGEAEFSAFAFQVRRRMAIFRVAFAASSVPGESFAFDDPLNSATIAPPPPFTGTATFQRITDFSTSWMGSLAVFLPGLGSVPLTGRDFVWSLRSQ